MTGFVVEIAMGVDIRSDRQAEVRRSRVTGGLRSQNLGTA